MKFIQYRTSESLLVLLVALLFSSRIVSSSLLDDSPQKRQVSNSGGPTSSLPDPTSLELPSLDPAPTSSGGGDDGLLPAGTDASLSTTPPFSNSTTTSSKVEPPRSDEPGSTSTVTQVPVPTKVTVTRTITDEFGRESTTTDVVPTTTMVSSDDPSLANGGEPGSPSGVTPQQKKIIIGVVVSVVGILSIVGVAGVIWRIWFSRRGSEEDLSLHRKETPPPLSVSSIPSGDGTARIVSGSDRRKKPAFGNMNPSSNF
ncbi:hypothetical protein TWF106_002748 [Orbilia oligospora]|uniref:Mid2 domain-containing protein n=1 Tax=Orbilia oligospora TaxID=2813651 RepID=A0A6G1LS60_ORBOL|nr:hypothetical protein TWF788_003761 [Orbilia oligospora]KAF3197892.1 hypothetical protein TWF679_002520 [Orbilia oligospora]KAF3201700.1 hypothetical protein TWF106_002748 [Orbilia oligospora]KAF3230526.1 hypothetical protein TWF191_009445 [Orbilia oligospora]KAF3233021.1 hypothetical protein TWF192_002572 [Orbilia oligospora]